jgi:hypothetical protein
VRVATLDTKKKNANVVQCVRVLPPRNHPPCFAHNRWSVSRLPLASNICGFTHLTYWFLGVSAFAQPAVLSCGVVAAGGEIQPGTAS